MLPLLIGGIEKGLSLLNVSCRLDRQFEVASAEVTDASDIAREAWLKRNDGRADAKVDKQLPELGQHGIGWQGAAASELRQAGERASGSGQWLTAAERLLLDQVGSAGPVRILEAELAT